MQHGCPYPCPRRAGSQSLLWPIYTECTDGTRDHGRTKHRPAPYGPTTGHRYVNGQGKGKVTGQDKGIGSYQGWARSTLTQPRPPFSGASRALSSETALTGPVRQRQAAAATRTAAPQAPRRHARSALPQPARTIGSRIRGSTRHARQTPGQAPRASQAESAQSQEPPQGKRTLMPIQGPGATLQ